MQKKKDDSKKKSPAEIREDLIAKGLITPAPKPDKKG